MTKYKIGRVFDVKNDFHLWIKVDSTNAHKTHIAQMAFWKEHFEGRNVVWRKGSAMDGIRLQLREGSFVLLFKILPLEGEYIQLYTPLPYNAIEEEFMKVGWMTIYYAVLHSNAPQKILSFYFRIQYSNFLPHLLMRQKSSWFLSVILSLYGVFKIERFNLFTSNLLPADT